MLPANRRRTLESLGDGDVVLDVGGWAKPFPRADWVIDLMPWDSRGLYGSEAVAGEPERFTEATWVRWDICSHEPWPFADGQFDFAICSHTLEDVRDPVWVCRELQRVARAGYIEVPSRREEQSHGIQGPWTGWGHHHWICDVDAGADPPRIDFVFKHHILHGHPDLRRPAGGLSEEERVSWFRWEGAFAAQERIFFDPHELHAWLAEVHEPPPPPTRRERLRRRLSV